MHKRETLLKANNTSSGTRLPLFQNKHFFNLKLNIYIVYEI